MARRVATVIVIDVRTLFRESCAARRFGFGSAAKETTPAIPAARSFSFSALAQRVVVKKAVYFRRVHGAIYKLHVWTREPPEELTVP